jgi:hypothetical protein
MRAAATEHDPQEQETQEEQPREQRLRCSSHGSSSGKSSL